MILWNLQEGNHQQSEGVLVGGAGPEMYGGWNNTERERERQRGRPG